MTGREGQDGRRPDSLDLLVEQDEVLTRIFAGWHDAKPETDAGDGIIVEAAWDRGTFGKLLIEHTAIRVAAKEDVARVLRDRGEGQLAETFTRHLHQVRGLLDRLDEDARGVQPVSVGTSESFAALVERLCEIVQTDINDETYQTLRRIAEALNRDRGKLRSARHIAREAPTHPGPNRSWYDDIPILARIHARYDHLRGFPWADSTDFADTALTKRIEPPT